MKKQINWLGSTYSNKSGPWVMVMLLSGSLLPVLLKSAAMLINQNTLPIWLILMFDLIGWIGMWVLLFGAVRKMNGHSGAHLWKGLWQTTLKGGLWLAAVFLISDVAGSLFLVYGSILAVTSSTFLFLVVQILTIILSGFFLSLLFYWNSRIITEPDQAPSFLQALRSWLKKPLLCLGSILIIIVIIYGVPFLYSFILAILPGLSPSFLAFSAQTVLISLMQWIFLQPLLMMFADSASKNHVQDLNNSIETPMAGPAASQDKKAPIFTKSQLPALFALVIIVASLIYNNINEYPVSPVEDVRKDIQYYMTQSNIMRIAGDFGAAVQYQQLAEGKILAWKGSVLDEPGALNQAATVSPSDEQVKLLAALKNDPSVGTLEQGLLNANRSKAWYLSLLGRYDKITDLNDIQKERRSEILRMCVLQGFYTMTDTMPDDFPTNKKDAFAKMLNGFTDQLAKGKYTTLMARLGEEGTLNRQLVFDTLDMAEKYPDQIDIQYLAMTLGTTYREDNASHYKRTAEAALRYDKLYMLKDGKTASEDKIINEKLTVAKTLVACKELKSCIDFISGVTYKSSKLDTVKAGCLFSLKSYDECLKVVSNILNKGKQDPQNLYLAAMSSLQLRDIKGSIQYALTLSKMVQEEKDPLQEEQLLYPFLLRFTTTDSSARYTTEAYNSLKEDEVSLLQSDPFLYNYTTALHLWAQGNSDNLNASLDCLEKVLAIRGNLSRALYVKGAVNFELQKDESAVTNYKASLDLDDGQPTVWYALANVYDRMAKYEEAYAACQKVLEYLPSTDHANDAYGVSVHASYLLNKLKQYVKEGT